MSSADAAAQLAQLLAALTHPDTNAIREAEVALKPLLKDGRSVPALVEVLKSRGTQVCVLSIAVSENAAEVVLFSIFEARVVLENASVCLCRRFIWALFFGQ